MNTFTIPELINLEQEINALCLEVGRYQMKNLGNRSLERFEKTNAIDVATEVDLRSEEMIIAFIRSKYPDHNILAEESGESNQESKYTWIIDPVDGTTNYAHGYPLFAISIGVKYEDEMFLGCIYLPALNLFYSAIKGQGATCNGESIYTSSVKTLDQAVMVTGFPYHKKTTANNNLDYFSAMMPEVAGIRRSGSACFDLVHVAHGRLEAYFEMYLNQWDIRPGILIVEEAGGKAKVIKKGKSYNVVATNAYLHEVLVTKLNSVRQGDY